VVATPIGNLDDITLRAVKVLEQVDIIAAEDTRRVRKLLSHHGISPARMIACHEHNEERITRELLDLLEDGANLALVSDAGTPLVSDPGYRLIQAAVLEGHSVVPVPGPTACTAAISVSGLPTDQFLFLGFLPRKKGQRQKSLHSLLKESRTMVIYESPHRISALLSEMVELWGEGRRALCAREMTKLHEEYLRGTLGEIAEKLAGRSRIRGEITLVVSGNPSTDGDGDLNLEHLLRSRLDEGRMSLSEVTKDLARILNLPRRQVYNAALRIQREKESG
jgi:16S rRNA (cytidine1402-2'-O)-methyltransferase